MAAGVVKEEDLNGTTGGVVDKPTLEGRSGHSRTGSGAIPPPPIIPGVGRLGLHSSTGSMDLGYGGVLGQNMQFSPSNAAYYANAGANRLRPPGHARHPSGSNSLHFLTSMDTSASSSHAPSSSSHHPSHQLHHTRHRSTASIGDSLMFPTVNMEDDLNVFEQTYQQ